MKYRVIGYTDYDWPDFADGENSDAAIEAIIEDIKKHGYCFSGYAHQEYDNCVPVLNDGLARRFSQRGWGGVMARANGFTGYMDYSSFAFSFGYEEEKTPPLSRYITPDEVEDIVSADSFSVELSSGALAAALAKGMHFAVQNAGRANVPPLQATLLTRSNGPEGRFSLIPVRVCGRRSGAWCCSRPGRR